MKLAIMQPYFFPYLGYWQLISAADAFVLFDDPQYMKGGWVNRNRILKPAGGWQYVTVPLERHSHREAIRNVKAHQRLDWRDTILRQLSHYRQKAPHFNATFSLIRSIFDGVADCRISWINRAAVQGICAALDLNREIIMSSEYSFDYSRVAEAGDWALRMAEQLHATEYINPISGVALYSHTAFARSGIKLSFLRPEETVYDQGGTFERSLSVIDALMFQGIEGTKTMLSRYSLHGSIETRNNPGNFSDHFLKPSLPRSTRTIFPKEQEL